MKQLFSIGIILSFFITIPSSVSAQSVSPTLCTEQNVFSTPNTGGFALDSAEIAASRSAMSWIYSMMEPLGAESNGGEVYLAQVYDFDHTGSISGSFTTEIPADYPVINPSLLTVTNPVPLANNYRGIVSGTANGINTAGTHIVRAYLFTDQEYEQPGVVPAPVAADGSWNIDLSAIPVEFVGSWHFRLYEIASNTEVGESWPREDILKDLEISLFSVTDAEYFIATQRALPTRLFNFPTTTSGTKRIKLIDNKGTISVADDVVLDTYTGGTGLVRSYELSAGEAGFGTSFQERSYVYDQALALSAAITLGDSTQASDLAGGLIQFQVSGGANDGAFTFSAPQLAPTARDEILRTGAHSIALYSLLQYIEYAPGNPDISVYRSSATRALAYLDTMKATTEPQKGLYKGGSGRYVADVFEDYIIPWASTEHNLDTWHVFKKAQKVLVDNSYAAEALELKNAMLSKLWNPGAERFYQGYGPTAPDSADALDTSSWGSMMLIGIGDNSKSETSLERLSVYQHTDVETGITGWAPYADVASYTGATPTVWYEGSFGVLMAYARNNLEALYESTLDDLKRGQLASGAFRYATDEDSLYEIITAPSIASTAWYILSTTGRDSFWQECSYIAPPASEVNQISNSSGGGTKRVCRDELAINFNNTKFGRTDNTLCKYPEMDTIEVVNFEVPVVKVVEQTPAVIQGATSMITPSIEVVPELGMETLSGIGREEVGADALETVGEVFISEINSIYEPISGFTSANTKSSIVDSTKEEDLFDYDQLDPIIIEEFPSFWEMLVNTIRNITGKIIQIFK